MAVFAPILNEAQYFNNNGDPLTGGKIFFYAEGSFSILKDTYTGPDESVANANPVVLNAAGRSATSFWLGAGSYNAVLTDANGTVLQNWDNIAGA